MDDSTLQFWVMRGVLTAYYGDVPVFIIQQRHLRMQCQAAVTVRKCSTADRTELDEVRKILDIAIVEKAVARRTEKDIERMRASLEKRKVNAEKGLLEECIEADLNFHIAIADAAHNRILADIYRSAATHLLSEFNRIYDGTDCFINSQTSHEKLLKHIIAGDLKNARKTATIIVEEP